MGMFDTAAPPAKFGGQAPRVPFFTLCDVGVPTPQRNVEVRRATTDEGIFAVTSALAKKTEKAGPALFLEVTCLVPPMLDNMPTMCVGDVRLVMGAPSNKMGWETACNLVAAAFSIPVAPEQHVAGIERIREIIGSYPKRYVPEDWSDDGAGARSPEDAKALADFLGVAIRNLTDWASEGEGERLTAKTNPDGVGILAIALQANSKYAKRADDASKLDFSQPVFGDKDGLHIVYTNIRPRRMDDALNLALAQAHDEGRLRAAKGALNADFLAGMAAAYAEYKAAEAGA